MTVYSFTSSCYFSKVLMQIHSLILPIPGNYPTPAQTGLAQQAPIVPNTRNTNADSRQLAVMQNEVTRFSPDRPSRRDAQPLYDQQLSHRGQRAQQLYTTIEYASDLELLNRIDELV
jgi:hypothetical protein